MNKLKWIAIAMFLVLSLTAATPDPFSSGNAYREACRLSRYECYGIPAPDVRESQYVNSTGALGIYFGGRTVWIAKGLSAETRYIVLVHEMVHYLQTYADEDGPPFRFDTEVCVYEEEAFEVSNQVARRLGEEEMSRERFQTVYRC